MDLHKQFEHQGSWLFKYRGILPLIILVAGIIVFINSRLDSSNFFYDKTLLMDYYIVFCIFICLIGLAIRVFTIGYAPDNTSGRNTSGQLADALNRTGMYSIVRHPLYVGNFIMWLGVALVVHNFWFVTIFILLYWIYYERIMYAEEQFLRRKFGETFTDWAARTPAFIPNFKLFVRPQTSFRWKKVLNQEKTGLAALFLIFSLFDLIEQLVRKSHDFNYVLHVICLITIILFCIVRYLKKKTRLLNDVKS
ncbi:MAG: isoprenylcysteine carboxylmethyltransferase family protein [Bacteroidales bacterium]|jgi:protein-S-isoprenylcysteine O-methyltransferase Ste14|nr:isoprenylcysteine carboxylmethyltransferase family protein [Bacteroidales bacterium]